MLSFDIPFELKPFCEYLGALLLLVVVWYGRGLKFRHREKFFRTRLEKKTVVESEVIGQLLLNATTANRNRDTCHLQVKCTSLEQGDVTQQVLCQITTWTEDGHPQHDTLIQLDFNGWNGNCIERSPLTGLEPVKHQLLDMRRLELLCECIYDAPYYNFRHVEKAMVEKEKNSDKVVKLFQEEVRQRA